MKLEFFCDASRHLVCKPYSVANLHRMARDLNIKRCWFHAGSKPHYDIPKMRQKEIMQKCCLVTEREILLIIKKGLKDASVQISLDF